MIEIALFDSVSLKCVRIFSFIFRFRFEKVSLIIYHLFVEKLLKIEDGGKYLDRVINREDD